MSSSRKVRRRSFLCMLLGHMEPHIDTSEKAGKMRWHQW